MFGTCLHNALQIQLSLPKQLSLANSLTPDFNQPKTFFSIKPHIRKSKEMKKN
jgi:hypothetical protein